MNHPNSFPLAEHLKSKTIIDKVYNEGASVTAYPLRAVFLTKPIKEKQPLATILISVAKKRFRHAVDRNLVKRRLREAYRLNKQPFIEELEKSGKCMAIAILYIDTKHNSTAFLKSKMKKLLGNIIEKERKICENS
ncbi:MAG: ribonuclease P protein component [Bacteroidaceae bacterium]|nr:ribonuclease P protein component [Bacteroidaceae bacterium]